MKSALNTLGLPIFFIVLLHLQTRGGFGPGDRHPGWKDGSSKEKPPLKFSHIPFREPSAGCSPLSSLLHVHYCVAGEVPNRRHMEMILIRLWVTEKALCSRQMGNPRWLFCNEDTHTLDVCENSGFPLHRVVKRWCVFTYAPAKVKYPSDAYEGRLLPISSPSCMRRSKY